MMQSGPTMSSPENSKVSASQQRKRWLLRLLFVVISLLVLFLAYWWWLGSRIVSTDNAYTATEVAQVAASVDGTIKGVNVIDTQAVKQGDVLAEIDPADAKLSLIEAQAELETTVRRVEGYFLNNQTLSAQVLAREADLERALAELQAAQADDERAAIDLKRRRALSSSGSVSADELTRAKNAWHAAQANMLASHANVALARANVESALGARRINQALTANTSVQAHPEVQLAQARKEQAQLNLDRTVIRAPISGVVAKRQVQLGQRVQAGTTLLAIVPTERMYVNANFKEVQLNNVRVGQSVEVISDWYGNAVKYRGTVTGFSGGSGASFAVIPAQNATGNWIKVVQRVPVRIALDPEQLRAHPLGVGLSMTVRIHLERP
jgi:membrane fusion protein (multidrug efflux system)